MLSSHPRADRAADAGAAEAAIAMGILRQILLVIILGEIKRRRLADFGGDRAHPFGRERLGVGGLGRFRGGVLLRRERIDAGAVLGADVAALAHALGRVVAFPERLEQAVIRNLLRVIDY